MLRINLGRVTIGGLLAGLIINIGEYVLHGVLIAEEMNAAMVALNRPPIAPAMITWFVVLTWGFAFVLVWTYAAIRPRFGPGVKTAICASTLCWGLGYLYPNLFFYVMDFFPRNMIIATSIWSLGEVVIAGVVGAWAYTEALTPAPQ